MFTLFSQSAGIYLLSSVPWELEMQPHFLATFFWGIKLVRFGQIWLDMGKIKFGNIEVKFWAKAIRFE